MNGTKIFEDSYCGVFAKQDEFLECLESIGRNSFWERKKSKDLRLVPITDGSRVAEELREKYAEEGLDEGIITDTILNTGLLLKVRNQYYPVRCCAIKSILDRAGISGAGLRRVEKNVYARILNDCLKVAKGEALLRISEGKVSAVLGGDCHDYAVLNMEQIFMHSVEYFNSEFKGCTWLGGFYEHDIPYTTQGTLKRSEKQSQNLLLCGNTVDRQSLNPRFFLAIPVALLNSQHYKECFFCLFDI